MPVYTLYMYSVQRVMVICNYEIIVVLHLKSSMRADAKLLLLVSYLNGSPSIHIRTLVIIILIALFHIGGTCTTDCRWCV